MRITITKNTNCLEGIACPKCTSLQPFRIEARVMVLVHDEGTGDEQGEYHWTDDAYCECVNCAHYGKLRDFRLPERERPGERAAVMHEETGIPYEDCLVMLNMD
jgi:hypothetical protein